MDYQQQNHCLRKDSSLSIWGWGFLLGPKFRLRFYFCYKYLLNRLKPSSEIFLKTVQRLCFFCGSFLLFMSCVCHAFASVHCCLVVTCWEKAHFLALFVMFKCVFVTFPCCILGQVWYLIVSIPDLCRLSYFEEQTQNKQKCLIQGASWF